jgi:hypothetical protein
MLHAGLDLGRRRLDVWRVDDLGAVIAHTVAPPEATVCATLPRG